MSVEHSAIMGVGFKLTEDEVMQLRDMISDDEFDDIYDKYLHCLDSWGGDCDYLFSDNVKGVDEGCLISVLELAHNINYNNYKDLINAFNRYFPFVDKETHQLDLWLGCVIS